MLLKSTVRWVCEVTNKLTISELHFGKSSGARFLDTDYIGLVSRSRPHSFVSLWKRKMSNPAQQWKKTLWNGAGSSKGCISRGFGLKFCQTVSSQARGTIRGWSQQGTPPGTAVQPSPAFILFVKTWKPNRGEPHRGCSKPHWCPLCWRLVSRGGRGVHPSAFPVQTPISSLQSSWRERSRAARGLRGKGICLQRFNSHISSSGTFLATPWPHGGTSHTQDGRVPLAVWEPLEKTFKMTHILCNEVRNREKPGGISSSPSPHLLGICAPFFFSLNISFLLSFQ